MWVTLLARVTKACPLSSIAVVPRVIGGYLPFSAARNMGETTATTEALWGLFVGDALAMPAHWFYNQRDIKSTYGKWLTDYVTPKAHPQSFMWRMPDRNDGIIGNVILHDKLKYWINQDRSTHYHQGLAAGDNTLNLMVALEIAKVMKSVDTDRTMTQPELQCAVMESYVKFMTTPGSHNDTYAENYHRNFFRDWKAEKCPPTSGKDIVAFCTKRWCDARSAHTNEIKPHIGIVPLVAPWVIRYADKPEDECVSIALEATKLVFPVPKVMPYLELYCRLLHSVLNGKDLKEEVKKALASPLMREVQDIILQLSERANSLPSESEEKLLLLIEGTNHLGPACYIEGATATMLFLALVHHDDFRAGVLANVNCGGENCHRGAALGALLGANAGRKGQSIPGDLKTGLHSAKAGIDQVASHL